MKKRPSPSSFRSTFYRKDSTRKKEKKKNKMKSKNIRDINKEETKLKKYNHILMEKTISPERRHREEEEEEEEEELYEHPGKGDKSRSNRRNKIRVKNIVYPFI